MNKYFIHFVAVTMFLMVASFISCNQKEPGFTIIFDADNGTPPVTIFIAERQTIPETDDPVKSTAEGLYEGTPTPPIFGGWYNGETKWNFDKKPLVDIKLKAKWIPTDIDLSAQSGNNIVNKAFNYVNQNVKPGVTYTFLLESDVTTKGSLTLTTAGANLTIIGNGETRTITSGVSANGIFCMLNADGASLTIGENITLHGRLDNTDPGEGGGEGEGTEPGEEPGTTPSTARFIVVQNGSLTMLDGSKITGHITSQLMGTVVLYGENAKFIMEGGEISGNKTVSDRSHASGGVFVNAGTLIMKGGSIKDNFNFSPLNAFNIRADVYLNTTVNAQFVMSGNAVIHTMIMDATISDHDVVNASIIIDGTYSGKVDALHLRENHRQFPGILWPNRYVIQAATGYNLTGADISKFTLGEFRNAGIVINPGSEDEIITITETQKITGNTDGTPNYRIDETGKLVKQ